MTVKTRKTAVVVRTVPTGHSGDDSTDTEALSDVGADDIPEEKPTEEKVSDDSKAAPKDDVAASKAAPKDDVAALEAKKGPAVKGDVAALETKKRPAVKVKLEETNKKLKKRLSPSERNEIRRLNLEKANEQRLAQIKSKEEAAKKKLYELVDHRYNELKAKDDEKQKALADEKKAKEEAEQKERDEERKARDADIDSQLFTLKRRQDSSDENQKKGWAAICSKLDRHFAGGKNTIPNQPWNASNPPAPGLISSTGQPYAGQPYAGQPHAGQPYASYPNQYQQPPPMINVQIPAYQQHQYAPPAGQPYAPLTGQPYAPPAGQPPAGQPPTNQMVPYQPPNQGSGNGYNNGAAGAGGNGYYNA